MERLAGRLGIGKLSPRQMAGISQALETAGTLKALLLDAYSSHLADTARGFPDCADLSVRISNALVDEPPLVTNKGLYPQMRLFLPAR